LLPLHLDSHPSFHLPIYCHISLSSHLETPSPWPGVSRTYAFVLSAPSPPPRAAIAASAASLLVGCERACAFPAHLHRQCGCKA
jgi:hypothetical protein